MRRPTARVTPNRVTIESAAWKADAAGGRQVQYPAPGPPISCSVQSQGSETQEGDRGNGRQQQATRYEVIFNDDPGLVIRDRLTWLDGGGIVLTVTGVRPQAAGSARSWVVEAVHVQ